MATFYIPQLKSFLPILKECYGFDIIEISSELTDSLRPYVDEHKMDEIVWEQRNEGKKRNVLLDYAINIDGGVKICTTEDFSGQIAPIEDLCNQHIENEDMRTTAKFILVFMAAIFNRETANNIVSYDLFIPAHLAEFISNSEPEVWRRLLSLYKQDQTMLLNDLKEEIKERFLECQNAATFFNKYRTINFGGESVPLYYVSGAELRGDEDFRKNIFAAVEESTHNAP